MGLSANNDVLDALLAEIATCNKICVCSAEPASHAEAFTTYMLAATALSGGNFSAAAEGSLGDPGGRKITITAPTDIYISNSGTASHVAVLDSDNAMFVTTCTPQQLTEAGAVTVPAFIIEVEAPTT